MWECMGRKEVDRGLSDEVETAHLLTSFVDDFEVFRIIVLARLVHLLCQLPNFTSYPGNYEGASIALMILESNNLQNVSLISSLRPTMFDCSCYRLTDMLKLPRFRL